MLLAGVSAFLGLVCRFSAEHPNSGEVIQMHEPIVLDGVHDSGLGELPAGTECFVDWEIAGAIRCHVFVDLDEYSSQSATTQVGGCERLRARQKAKSLSRNLSQSQKYVQ